MSHGYIKNCILQHFALFNILIIYGAEYELYIYNLLYSVIVSISLCCAENIKFFLVFNSMIFSLQEVFTTVALKDVWRSFRDVIVLDARNGGRKRKQRLIRKVL